MLTILTEMLTILAGLVRCWIKQIKITYIYCMKARLMDTGLHAERQFRVKYVDKQFLDSHFHFHDACEIVLIEEGYGKRIVGDHVEEFEEGDLVLMGPNLPHIWRNDNEFFLEHNKLRVKATVIYFAPAMVLSLITGTDAGEQVGQLFTRAARGLRFGHKTNALLAGKFSDIVHAEGLKKVSLFLETVDLLSHAKDFTYLASETYKNAMTSRDAGRFNDVYQHLITNFHRDIPLDEIAGVARMSPTAFCRYFRTRTQKSFVQFLQEIRIAHACKLLRHENLSIMEVCLESGYNNLVNFNKCFKNITSQSPSEYRKKLLQEAMPV